MEQGNCIYHYMLFHKQIRGCYKMENNLDEICSSSIERRISFTVEAIDVLNVNCYRQWARQPFLQDC